MQPVRALAASVSAGVALAGCSFRYEPVTVRVTDAETGAAITGASVSLAPGSEFFLWRIHPRSFIGTTDEAGSADLRMAVEWPYGAQCRVAAAGYEPKLVYVVVGTRPHVPENWRMIPLDGERVIDLPLVRVPILEVTLLLPDDLRGWVRVNMPVGAEASGTHTERSVIISLMQSRDVQAPSGLALGRFWSHIPLRARTAGGVELQVVEETAEHKPDRGQVAVWPFWWLDGGRVYFIGTESELTEARAPSWLRGGRRRAVEVSVELREALRKPPSATPASPPP